MKKCLSLATGMLCILLMSACHSLPEHAKYIPEDAAVVVGLNTGALSKKVAWSAITGSKILDEMKEGAKNEKGTEALKDIEESGIDFGSTIYGYGKPDKRFDNEMRLSIIAPLEDAKKWEAFMKKLYPTASIAKVKERSETMLGGKAYAAWTDKVLMVSNMAMMEGAPVRQAPVVAYDSAVTDANVDAAAALNEVEEAADDYAFNEKQPDAATTSREMDAAFSLKSDASIKENKRFKKLDGEGHDITLFVSAGSLMDSYAGKAGDGMGMMSGMMGGSMWKNTAMAAGIDFEKGKITGLMHYYPSDSMKEVAKAYGAENIDKDLLSRIPAQNLNMIAAYHLSPKATKMLLDKMSLSGMANLFLMQKGLSVDEILAAFTGDMVVAINNFKMEPTPAMYDSSIGYTIPAGFKQKSDFVFSMKIGKKESFNKLFKMATAEGGLQQTSPNVYALPGMDGATLFIGDQYLVVANNATNAQAYLQKAGGKLTEPADKIIAGHPAGFFMDFNMLGGIDNSTMGITDPVVAEQIKKFLTNASMSGGEYKGDGNEYNMTLNFSNKEENSLVQMMQMAQRIAAANKKQGVAASF